MKKMSKQGKVELALVIGCILLLSTMSFHTLMVVVACIGFVWFGVKVALLVRNLICGIRILREDEEALGYSAESVKEK